MNRKVKINKDGSIEIQHFDVGGAVQPVPTNNSGGVAGAVAPGSTALPQQTTVGGGSQISSGLNGLTGPVNSSEPSWFQNIDAGQGAIQAINQGVGGAVDAGAGLVKGLGSALTQQNTYQAQLAPTQQTNYGGVVEGAANNSLNGYNQSSQIQGQEQNLSNQLGQQAQGQGPNPAQAALNQSTGQNINAEAALAAGQRGASSNVGLLERQNAQQGANTQQQAIGQGATLQAQQQLNAQTAQASVLNNQATQNTAEQTANNSLFGSASSAQNTQNANTISDYGMAQGINSQVAQNNANAVNKTTGGILNGLGGAASMSSLLAKGGFVKYAPHLAQIAKIYHGHKFADGGAVAPDNVPNLSDDGAVASSGFTGQSGGGGGGGGLSSLAGLAALFADGGSVAQVNTPNLSNDTAVASSGFTGIQSSQKKAAPTTNGQPSGPSSTGAPAAATNSAGPQTYSAYFGGGKVPGKDKVNHNSYSNDTVPAMLSPGEMVLPIDVMNSKDPVKAAADFVAKHLKKQYESKQHNDFSQAVKKAAGARGKK